MLHNSKNDRATLENQSGESGGDRTRDQVANQKYQYPMNGFGADGKSTILKVAHIGLVVMSMNIYTYKYRKHGITHPWSPCGAPSV